ncbi:MAG: hypothetical protein SFU53_04435 [Terrimicrobiaceae bacterium]|nr:hypothetical protein [Terrimicrobiaceae bacterium]
MSAALEIQHGLGVSSGSTVFSGARVLEGPDALRRISVAGRVRRAGDWQIWESGERFFAVAAVRVGGRRLAAATFRLYRQLFEAVSGRMVYRIWHFVPAINSMESGLENYRAFCLGRHAAFQHFSIGGHPAASAVGSAGDELVAWCLAGPPPVRPLENPLQIPAYHYPVAYGPRPPRFSRAVVTRDEIFVSGTSSIRGHETVARRDTATQLAVTLDNMQAVLAQANLDWRALAHAGSSATVYLRRAADLPSVRRALQQAWGTAEKQTLYLQADICRIELDIEIECRLALNPTDRQRTGPRTARRPR